MTALRSGPPVSAPGIIVREAPASSNSSAALPTSPASGNTASIPPPSNGEIVVHVAGAVKKPGVYHLNSTARNDDAVKAAGGFTASANTDAINLAAHLEDGVQLYIPTRSEHPSGGASSQETSSAPTGNASHSKSAKTTSRRSHSSGKLSDPSQGTINLNTADSAQLQRIPGIGPAMAERILAYRRSTRRFQSPDELLQISGIGDKKYQKLKPFLSVR